MENPFEIIEQRLNSIEQLLTELVTNANKPVIGEDKEEQMTVDQLSNYLTIARQTIYGKCGAKEIPHIKTGKRLYFKKSDIDKWLDSGKRQTATELHQQAEEWIRRHPRKI